MADTQVTNWSDLPSDLLIRILGCLNAHVYHSLLGAVCPAWRSSLPPCGEDCPLLRHQLRLQSDLPSEIQEKIFFIVSSPENQLQKWVIQVSETGPNTWSFFNPLTGGKFSFPLGAKSVDLLDFRITELGRSLSLKWSYDSITHQVCSSLASRNFCVFMGLSRYGHLCFLESGFEKWVKFYPKSAFGEDLEEEDYGYSPTGRFFNAFEDIVSFKGQFYAVDGKGRLVTFDPVSWQEPALVVTSPLNIKRRWGTAVYFYLVESEGSLYLVLAKQKFRVNDWRFIFEEGEDHENNNNGTTQVQVFVLTEEKGSDAKWVEVRTIGDRVFFIGGNASFSVSSSTSVLNEKNCIYLGGVAERSLMESRAGSELGAGKYDLDAGEFVRFNDWGDGDAHARLFWPPPSWISGCDPYEWQHSLSDIIDFLLINRD